MFMGSYLMKRIPTNNKKSGIPLPPALWAEKGVFSKIVLVFRNFGYDFWGVGGDVWRWLWHVCRKISAHVDGGQVEGLAFTDPGARTPIGVSWNLTSLFLPSRLSLYIHPHFWCIDNRINRKDNVYDSFCYFKQTASKGWPEMHTCCLEKWGKVTPCPRLASVFWNITVMTLCEI